MQEEPIERNWTESTSMSEGPWSHPSLSKPLSIWAHADTAHFLSSLGLSQYVPLLPSLQDATLSSLKSQGILSYGHRKLLLSALEQLQKIPTVSIQQKQLV